MEGTVSPEPSGASGRGLPRAGHTSRTVHMPSVGTDTPAAARASRRPAGEGRPPPPRPRGPVLQEGPRGLGAGGQAFHSPAGPFDSQNKQRCLRAGAHLHRRVKTSVNKRAARPAERGEPEPPRAGAPASGRPAAPSVLGCSRAPRLRLGPDTARARGSFRLPGRPATAVLWGRRVFAAPCGAACGSRAQTGPAAGHAAPWAVSRGVSRDPARVPKPHALSSGTSTSTSAVVRVGPSAAALGRAAGRAEPGAVGVAPAGPRLPGGRPAAPAGGMRGRGSRSLSPGGLWASLERGSGSISQ